MAQANVHDIQTNGVNGDAGGGNFDIEAIVIGAGFSGLRMLYELRKRGIAGKVFESGSGVGGV
jgi:cyclohexanone monooxygenase